MLIFGRTALKRVKTGVGLQCLKPLQFAILPLLPHPAAARPLLKERAEHF